MAFRAVNQPTAEKIPGQRRPRPDFEDTRLHRMVGLDTFGPLRPWMRNELQVDDPSPLLVVSQAFAILRGAENLSLFYAP